MRRRSILITHTRTHDTAENPLYLCRQHVGAATQSLDSERLVSHPTTSAAYHAAVAEDRVKRVNVKYDYATYAFNVFLDAASEPSGESFMMGHAVSCHLPTDEQCKPDNWIVVLVGETQKGASKESNTALDHAYFNTLFDGLCTAHERGVIAYQCWAANKRRLTRTVVLPSLHSLLEDDPQQKKTMCVSGCCFCVQPNNIRCSICHLASKRTEGSMTAVIEDGIEQETARQAGDVTTRTRSYRLAKAHAQYMGLSWPPQRPPTFGKANLTASGAYWLQNYLWLHNVGLCLFPDSMQLALQLIFLAWSANWPQSMRRSKEYVVSNFGDWRILKGSSKRRGPDGVLIRQSSPGAMPRVRRGVKYNTANAMRFWRVWLHPTLVAVSPQAAKGLHRLVEFSRQVKCPTGLVDSERGEMRLAATELLSLMTTAAEVTGGDDGTTRLLKDLHKCPNWHKTLHAAEIAEWLGALFGAGNDEHGELMQKLLHIAYRQFSSKQIGSGLLPQVAEWIVRYSAVQHGTRMVALCNDDMVTAARLGLAKILQKLLVDEKLVDAFIPDATDNVVPASRALMQAVTHSHVTCARILLTANADPNARDEGNGTALIAAARANDMDMLRLLRDFDASLSPTWQKLNAIQWAEYAGHTTAVRMLRDSSPVPPPSPSRRPTPPVDCARNRLRPATKGARRWLDLTQLRPRGAPQESRPCWWRELSHQLEFSLRVWCNGGNEHVASEQLPKLPKESLVLDVRPGVKFGADAPDVPQLRGAGWTDCYSPSKLRCASPTLAPSVSLDGMRWAVPQFVSVMHDDDEYDVYLAEAVLCFGFKHVTYQPGVGEKVEIKELVLVRWMDDAPEQEDLGAVPVSLDKKDSRTAWEEIKRMIESLKVRPHQKKS